MTDTIIAALLYLYPPRWRLEYGAELHEVLQQRPFTPGVAAELAWRGVCQRWHDGGPVLAIGLFMLPWVCLLIGANLNDPQHYLARCNFGLLRDTRYLVPNVEMAPGGPNFFAFVLFSCGLITRLRERVPLSRSGLAATHLALVAGLPVIILGALLLSGVVDLRVITHATANSAMPANGRAVFTYCTEADRVPSALAIFAAPLLRLPQAFVYGLFGGWVASAVRRRRETQPS